MSWLGGGLRPLERKCAGLWLRLPSSVTMNCMPSTKWADTSLAWGTALMVVIALGATAWRFWPASTEGLKPGDRISPRLVQPKQWTMIAVMSPQCGDCTESMAFYRRLFLDRPGVSLVVVGPAGADELRVYGQANGLNAARYESISQFDSNSLGTIPALLLVDRSGAIRSIWRGRLSPNDERLVEDALEFIR